MLGLSVAGIWSININYIIIRLMPSWSAIPYIENAGVCEKVHQTFVFLRYSELFFTPDIVTILQDIYSDSKHKTARAS